MFLTRFLHFVDAMANSIISSSALQNMGAVNRRIAALGIGCLGLLVVNTSPLQAQTIPITKPERLSKILESTNYSTEKSFGETKLDGIMWNSPAEIETQKLQKEKLLKLLSNLKENNLRFPEVTAGINQLDDLIQKLPVTGRVLLPRQDPRWLEAHPPTDPILNRQDTLTLPSSSRYVTVIRDDGRVCQVPFRSQVYAVHYTTLCDIKDNALSNWAWVIQADGSFEKVGLSSWSQNTQRQPSPGSWIWAPSSPKLFRQTIDALPWTKKRHFTDEFSNTFAEFLSTQGPSDLVKTNALIKADRSIIDSPMMLVESQRFEPKDANPLSSDWGSIGLLQTPTARMLPAGSGLMNYTHVTPYTYYNFLLQPFDGLETTFRYTVDTNQAYGSADLSGSQSYLDKSIDVKLRLLKENAQLPELALGIRDVTGTGLFSGEYIVGSKRSGDFDFSLGLAWGYMGNRGNIKNPLSFLGSGFSTRPTADVGQGGNLSFNTYFHGPTALIGGVQYQTPIPKLSLKMELDGNNYQHEPFGDAFTQRIPVNLGAVYRWNNASMSVGIERGNTAMISFTLFDNLSKLSVPKLFEAAPIPVSYQPIAPPKSFSNIDPNYIGASPSSLMTKTDQVSSTVMTSQLTPLQTSNMTTVHHLRSTGEDIKIQSGWLLKDIQQDGQRWIVTLDDVTGVYMKDRINRVISVLHRDAPLSITEFDIQFQNHQLALVQQKVNRQAWMLKQQQLLPPSQAKFSEPQVVEYVQEAFFGKSLKSNNVASQSGQEVTSFVDDHPPPKRLTGSLGLGFQQNVGGPDGYLFAFSGVGKTDLRLWDGAWINGVANVRFIDNYDKFTYDAPSNLPRVRTYLREYMTTSRATIPNLQATQVVKVGDNNYFSAYGGMLEMMFGGVGGEWLYRPLNSSLAIGIDINEVRQRDFDQRFTFMDYQVFTGHLTAYWETGWNDILVKPSIGQYLAGDRGFTLDMSRSFSNGVRMGAYFTKTNVSAEQFGEGSFDKGIYVMIPFDAFFTKHTSNIANLLWAPLIRDGGAKLNRLYPLYDMTTMRDNRAMQFGPPATQ